jgi:hypothetical protein
VAAGEQGENHESVVRADEAVREAVAIAAAAAYVYAVYTARKKRSRSWQAGDYAPLFECALAAEGIGDVQRALKALEPPLSSTVRRPPRAPPQQVWSTEGQCEGKTRYNERCRVHKSSRYAVAQLLRRGERFCGHHHPAKFTGVRCAGIKKHGKGQCRVWSGSFYSDAAPLRRGSPFCRHHRVRCEGWTCAGARCTVTSSSEHTHAEPLRQGKRYCMHHQGQDDGFVLYECEACGDMSALRVGVACAHICPASDSSYRPFQGGMYNPYLPLSMCVECDADG